MAAKVVTLTSGKGGVGKTTATANLASALAAENLKVVCIDADIGLRNLDVVLGLGNRIAPADIVIVITNPEVAAVRDADRIIGLIEAEEKGPARLIINRLKPAMVKREEMLSPDDVLELLAVELIGIVPG